MEIYKQSLIEVDAKYQVGNDETFPVSINWFKVNNKNTGKRYDIFSKLTTKTPEQRH